MGLKESGLRGSLRNVSVGIDAIPDSGGDHEYHFADDASTTIVDQVGDEDLAWSDLDFISGVGVGDFIGDPPGTSGQGAGFSDNTVFPELRNGPTGTFFATIRQDNLSPSDNNAIIATEMFTGDGTDVDFGLSTRDDGSYRFNLVLNDDRTELEVPIPSDYEGEFVFLVGKVRDGTMFLQSATTDDPSLTTLDSGDSPSSTSNDWDETPVFGHSPANPERALEYPVDYSFYHPDGLADSDLQDIIDDLIPFYE